MSNIADNLGKIRERIAASARQAGREADEVTLVAVSKRHPLRVIEEAYAAGQRDFGENTMQELRTKAQALRHLDIRWHFIGRIQTNKARFLAPITHLAHGVDSTKLAAELSRRAAAAGRVLPVLIQVNIAQEERKSGVEVSGLPDLLERVVALENLELRGLMIIPPFLPAPELRPFFRQLATLRRVLKRTRPGLALPELSMGMSEDFEIAIEEGATLVRVGTAVFGPRDS